MEDVGEPDGYTTCFECDHPRAQHIVTDGYSGEKFVLLAPCDICGDEERIAYFEDVLEDEINEIEREDREE